MSEKKVGFFIVSYKIGTGDLGATTFTVHLGIDTVNEAVSGSGLITQAVNPPVHVSTNLQGQYSYMATMQDCHILVVCEGHPVIKWPKGGGIGPVIPPNVHLRMVLTEDWKSGVANYAYVNDEGKTVEIKGVPVEKITGETL
jgi:hypothetical protein